MSCGIFIGLVSDFVGGVLVVVGGGMVWFLFLFICFGLVDGCLFVFGFLWGLKCGCIVVGWCMWIFGVVGGGVFLFFFWFGCLWFGGVCLGGVMGEGFIGFLGGW